MVLGEENRGGKGKDGYVRMEEFLIPQSLFIEVGAFQRGGGAERTRYISLSSSLVKKNGQDGLMTGWLTHTKEC